MMALALDLMTQPQQEAVILSVTGKALKRSKEGFGWTLVARRRSTFELREVELWLAKAPTERCGVVAQRQGIVRYAFKAALFSPDTPTDSSTGCGQDCADDWMCSLLDALRCT